MTIRSWDKYFDEIWDWRFVNMFCFRGTNIQVSDIDGIVERNGQFLVLETKLPDTEIPLGQQRMFDAMVSTGVFSILIIWGHRNSPEACKLILNGNETAYPVANEETVKNIVATWFKLVNANGGFIFK